MLRLTASQRRVERLANKLGLTPREAKRFACLPTDQQRSELAQHLQCSIAATPCDFPFGMRSDGTVALYQDREHIPAIMRKQ